MDDWKLSYRKRNNDYHTIEWTRQEYEIIFDDKSGNISVSRGKIHEYLVITLDYTVHGQVSITVNSYIK